MKKIIPFIFITILAILSLQGTLANFASGITIILFKPYKVGDYVEISEKFGVVKSIEVLTTTITTPSQKTLLISNNEVTSGNIINHSNKGYVQLELKLTIPYTEDFPKVKSLMINALKGKPELLQKPEPEVGILSYDSQNMTIIVRPFVKPADYWGATFNVYGAIEKSFNENGIKVAYSEGVELGLKGK